MQHLVHLPHWHKPTTLVEVSILEGVDSSLKQICIDCTNNNLSVNFEQSDDKQIRCFSNPIENSVLK